MKNLLIILTAAVTFVGCSTIYSDSAKAGNDGIYITGSHSNQKAIYYCPKSLDKTDCKQVKIINK